MSTDIKAATNLNNPFLSLRHRNFRFYWSGMCISLIGTWMQNIAQPWLAYTLTKSPFLLGLVGALQFAPMLLFSLFAGVLIDKLPKKKILLITQSSSMVIALILSILVWTGQIRFWHILVMAACLGFVNTMDMPTRQSFVIELVGREDLMNAIALNSSVFNIARIIGPALAGVVMGYVGVAACFFANAVSYGAVLIGLLFVKPLPLQVDRKATGKIIEEIKDGLKYIFKSAILLRTLTIMAVVGIFGMNFSVLVPVFAKTVLNQQETGFGFLMSFMGVGSFIGAMTIAMKSASGPQKIILNIFPVAISVLLILTGFTNIFVLTGLCLAAAGFCFVSFTSTANSTMQLNTKNEFRGRVMSVYTLVFGGTTPLGNLYAGAITDRFGPQAGFAACGAAIIILVAVIFAVRKNRQPDNILADTIVGNNENNN